MKKKYLLPLLLPVQIVVVKAFAFFPEIVEKYYSNGLYPLTSLVERALFGRIPFSFGDIVYGIVASFAIRWFWKTRKTWKLQWKTNLRKITAVLSVVYLFFHVAWAMNYYRVRLPQKLHIETDYDRDELVAFTSRLIEKTNGLQLDIAQNPDSIIRVPYSRNVIYEKSIAGYSELQKEYPGFALHNPSIKNSLISLPLSYMGFSGYLNPFTNEAQVNSLGPLYSFAGTSCHEMAHQIGYASESEANFVGYLAAIHSKDNYIRYSGYTMALKYCLRSLSAYDKDKADEMLKRINPGIRANFKESKDFWEKYESFLEIGFKFFYDNFLKMNQQDEGLESYNRFVDLLVNYYDGHELK
ncbi:DUF3810 domain-containing protein [Flavobacterium silvaticum]|uniref:DUF3810 domain-containing protein n=1 Tax=Flavobacterium silvaticum TaxID=1852020 RepID=A0A972FKS1_9FLAO|nr:DUF3810 domain-containing protein [Flavobacterium silvaticum]NMH27834.1 DUF3810 domain-containing protein [Flavobacterium silvaticum]